MTTPHKHADILRAIADGKKIEVKGIIDGRWCSASLHVLANSPSDTEFRIVPETVTINGVECPKPKQGKVTAPYGAITIVLHDSFDSEQIYFATKADARTVFDALCLPFKDGV